MKFLIDTNVFIPLEPSTITDLTGMTPFAAEFIRRAQEGAHEIFYHPIIEKDIQSDRDDQRKTMRLRLLAKYRALPQAPGLSEAVTSKLGSVEPDSHDWVDYHLLSALERDAIDCLVTEDKGIKRKSKTLGLEDRVFNVTDAIAYFVALSTPISSDHSDVVSILPHSLNENDPIFETLRLEYKGFDAWLKKVKVGHRPCFVLKRNVHGIDRLAALCILKEEQHADFGLSGPILKMCTFKVSSEFSGSKLGELLLSRVFSEARARRRESIYVTVLPSHPELISFLQEFGFSVRDEVTEIGEFVMTKSLSPNDSTPMTSLEYHIRYGPGLERLSDCKFHMIPIQPAYHELLFPEGGLEPELIATERPYRNAIRKVYLCHAPSRRIAPGDILLFYRSADTKAITNVCVAEKTLVSEKASEIARFAGLRTVYSFQEVEEMCKKAVLAILFRYSRPLKQVLRIDELTKAKMIGRAPQSIAELRGDNLEWLKNRIA